MLMGWFFCSWAEARQFPREWRSWECIGFFSMRICDKNEGKTKVLVLIILSNFSVMLLWGKALGLCMDNFDCVELNLLICAEKDKIPEALEFLGEVYSWKSCLRGRRWRSIWLENLVLLLREEWWENMLTRVFCYVFWSGGFDEERKWVILL